MASISFNNLRLVFYKKDTVDFDEHAVEATRPLTPDEVNQVKAQIGEVMFSNSSTESWLQFCNQLAEGLGEPRTVEVDWDEEISY